MWPLLCWILLLAAAGRLARRRGRSAASWAAAAGWISLPLYDMWLREGCGGDCGIRIDLLIVAPALIGLTAAALRSFALRRRTGK